MKGHRLDRKIECLLARSCEGWHQLGFPLLSDPESKTIEAYHIRNEAAKGKAEGVPNPGIFILDQDGVIRVKLFLDGYRDRHSTDALIEVAKVVK